MRFRAGFCLAVMLAWAQGGWAQSSWPETNVCTTRSAGTLLSQVSGDAQFLHVFELSCRGGIRGELSILGGQLFTVQLQLERAGPEGWEVVDTGHHIAYSGVPGRYRFVVENTVPDAPATWRLHYSIPF